jgi:hypothetical protein
MDTCTRIEVLLRSRVFYVVRAEMLQVMEVVKCCYPCGGGVEYVHRDPAVLIKNYIFWDITTCSPLKINGCSGGKLFASFLRVEKYGKQISCVKQVSKQG